MDDVLISYFFLIFRSLRVVRPDNFLAPVDVGARPAWRLKMRLGDEASPPSLLLSISPPLGHEGHSNLLWIRRDINASHYHSTCQVLGSFIRCSGRLHRPQETSIISAERNQVIFSMWRFARISGGFCIFSLFSIAFIA